MEEFGLCEPCEGEKRLEWFKAAKFGMFIHWGVYAQLAGSWKGKEIGGIGEQIMRFARIPAAEYREIAKTFNPVNFDADKWVALAKRAGMRYIVITAKHHDGFAMYHSRVSPYNIVDATPFKRDPMKELARACQEKGVKLCFYYSHMQDWDDPDGFVNPPQWDRTYPDEIKVLERYMNRKALPQVMELLTQYGPVGIVWYDTPGPLSDYNATRFYNLVHAIQPECLVSTRVSKNPQIGDYGGYGDNQVPLSVNPLPWETCATMNDTWGYKAQDHNWKSSASLIRLLVSIVSKGGNYLLNVGPTKEGEIPGESVERLEKIGQWMDNNGRSIYEAEGCLLKQVPEWGAVTGKEGKLFIHLFSWTPGEFVFTGLKNRVLSARVLSTGAVIPHMQKKFESPELDVLTLMLPKEAPDEAVSVIELDISGCPQVEEVPNDAGGSIELAGFCAEILSKDGTPELRVGNAGIIESWKRSEDYLGWKMLITRPGAYKVQMHTLSERHPERLPVSWEGGHEFTLSMGGESLDFTVSRGEMSYPRDNHQWQNFCTECGTLSFSEAGEYRVELLPRKIVFDHGFGPKLRCLKLIRV